eukprot:c9335_g1_i2.p1 GENE.c9335_g1_i2~~c9335_g1_i2.p1  ORF type:complete len:140 (-),score=21.31 c9335_g1_i2:41-460(-)
MSNSEWLTATIKANEAFLEHMCGLRDALSQLDSAMLELEGLNPTLKSAVDDDIGGITVEYINGFNVADIVDHMKMLLSDHAQELSSKRSAVRVVESCNLTTYDSSHNRAFALAACWVTEPELRRDGAEVARQLFETITQ